MNLLVVDGVALPTPDEMTYKEADLQWDGYRDELGYMHKTTVRWGVRSINVKWNRSLSDSDITLIRNAVRGQEYRTVQYFTDVGNHSGTMTAYFGADMDFKLVSVDKNDKGTWKELVIDIIEQ